MPAFRFHHRSAKSLAALLLAGALAAFPALASEGSGGDGDKLQSDPRSVTIPVVIAPVVDGGRLVGYIYLGLKVTAAEERAAERMRDELPLLQDRILRAFNSAPIAASEAGSDAAKAALVKTATAALAGLKEAEGVQSVQLTDIQNVPF